MINTILINENPGSLQYLEDKISIHCPQVQVCGSATTISDSFSLIEKIQPQLVFIETGKCNDSCYQLLNKISVFDFETILVSTRKDFAFDAIPFQISGYILKPVHDSPLKEAVKIVERRLKIQKESDDRKQILNKILQQHSSNELIGIPTIEGYEFISVNEIVRCEGLQKCTRVITESRTDIISSYNIGEFRKLLEKYGFFSPHKSYLINLQKVTKYYREGTLLMSDKSTIPVARRRKNEFLNQMPHL